MKRLLKNWPDIECGEKVKKDTSGRMPDVAGRERKRT